MFFHIIVGRIPNAFRVWEYVIAGKCPDFIDFKAKIIIEINGRYYHRNDKENERESHFSKYGYKTITIWEEELKDESKVIDKINSNLVISKK